MSDKKRILVVDDEPDFSSIVKANLEAEGFEVEQAFDGVEGLAKIKLTAARQKTNRWLWLRAGGKKEVVFKGLIAPDAGIYKVRCGGITQNLQVEQ